MKIRRWFLVAIAGAMIALATPPPARELHAQIPIGGRLSVSPMGGFTSSGQAGGPFSPPSMIYTLTDTGDQTITWAATNSQSWVTINPAGGSLAPSAGTDVTVSINSNANTLTPGTYTDTVMFTNQTSGSGSTSRTVTLIVSSGPPPTITVSPPPPATTGTSPLTVTGTATPGPGGFAISQVTWTNENSDWSWAGYASGTTSWTAQINLAPGENDITIIVMDTAGGKAVISFTVSYQPTGGARGGGGGGSCGATGLEVVVIVGLLAASRRKRARPPIA
jgi:hypothetical protein